MPQAEKERSETETAILISQAADPQQQNDFDEALIIELNEVLESNSEEEENEVNNEGAQVAADLQKAADDAEDAIDDTQSQLKKTQKEKDCSMLAKTIALATVDALDAEDKEEKDIREKTALTIMEPIREHLNICHTQKQEQKNNDQNSEYILEQLGALHGGFVSEIATALRHGSSELTFRLYRGVIEEDGLWTKWRSVFWNVITPHKKSLFLKPKQVVTADPKDVDGLIKDAITTVAVKIK